MQIDGGPRDERRPTGSATLLSAQLTGIRNADAASSKAVVRQSARRGLHFIRLTPLRLPARGPAHSEPVRRKRVSLLAREPLHACQHPLRAVERQWAALHAEGKRAVSRRSGYGVGACVRKHRNRLVQVTEIVRIERKNRRSRIGRFWSGQGSWERPPTCPPGNCAGSEG
jgi:hypothetical protein